MTHGNKEQKNKFLHLLALAHQIKKSELAEFWSNDKFTHSLKFHQAAVFAAKHCKEHGDTTYMLKILDFFGYGSINYLKTVAWFENRTGFNFEVTKNLIRIKTKNNEKIEENLEVLGDFLKNYKGILPVIEQNELDEPEYIENSNNIHSRRDSIDEFDLIDSPLRIAGKQVFGGYGTGKRR